MKGDATPSEWEFFYSLETYFEELELNALAQAETKESLHGKPEFGAVLQRLFSVTNHELEPLRIVFHSMRNREEMPWTKAEGAAKRAVHILNAIALKYKVGSLEKTQEISAWWESMEPLPLAFSLQRTIMRASLEEPSTFAFKLSTPSSNSVQLILRVPEALAGEHGKITNYLTKVINITLLSVDLSEKGIIRATISSKDEIKPIQPEFVFKKHTIKVEIIEQFLLTLYPLSDGKDESDVELALEGGLDITSVCVHKPNREDRTIDVELESQKDCDAIREHGILMVPARLTVLDSALMGPYVAYLRHSLQSREHFKAMWEKYYGFIPNIVGFAADMRSVGLQLSLQQYEATRKVALLINHHKVLIAPCSQWRVKVSFLAPISLGGLKAALSTLGDSASMSIVSENDEVVTAYVHLGSDAHKTALLCADISVPLLARHACPPTSMLTTPPYSHIDITNAHNKLDQSVATTEGRQVVFQINAEEGVTEYEVSQAFKFFLNKMMSPGDQWIIDLVLLQDGSFYIATNCRQPDLVSKVKHITMRGKQVDVKTVNGLSLGEVPYHNTAVLVASHQTTSFSSEPATELQPTEAQLLRDEKIKDEVEPCSNDIILDESTIVPLSLKINVDDLEKKYAVKTVFDKHSRVLAIYGPRQSVSDLKQYVSEIINSSRTSESPPFAPETFKLLVKVLSSGEWDDDIKMSQTAVTPNKKTSTIQLSGLPPNVQFMRARIMHSANSVKRRSAKVNLYHNHLIPKLHVLIKMELGKCVVVSIQNNKDSSDPLRAEKHGGMVTIWYLPKLAGKVDELLGHLTKGLKTQRINYTPEQKSSIRLLDLPTLGETHLVDVSHDILKSMVYINGFLSERVNAAAEEILKHITKPTFPTKQVQLAKPLFQFLLQKGAAFRNDLKQRFGLHRVKFIMIDKEGREDILHLEGQPSQIARAEREVVSRQVHFEEQCFDVDRGDFIQLYKEQLKSRYAVAVYVPRPHTTRLVVVGEADLGTWDLIRAELANMAH